MTQIKYLEEKLENTKKEMMESLKSIKKYQAIVAKKETEILRLQNELIDELTTKLKK